MSFISVFFINVLISMMFAIFDFISFIINKEGFFMRLGPFALQANLIGLGVYIYLFDKIMHVTENEIIYFTFLVAPLSFYLSWHIIGMARFSGIKYIESRQENGTNQ